MLIHPPGTPGGICIVLRAASTPPSGGRLIGTPITGSVVFDAMTPARAALMPAAATITFSPRSAAAAAYSCAASSDDSGGGDNNAATSTNATVGGGAINTASGHAATVSGGEGVTASGNYATVSGGGRTDPFDPATGNRVTDDYGTIGGGGNNQDSDADESPEHEP